MTRRLAQRVVLNLVFAVTLLAVWLSQWGEGNLRSSRWILDRLKLPAKADQRQFEFVSRLEGVVDTQLWLLRGILWGSVALGILVIVLWCLLPRASRTSTALSDD